MICHPEKKYGQWHPVFLWIPYTNSTHLDSRWRQRFQPWGLGLRNHPLFEEDEAWKQTNSQLGESMFIEPIDLSAFFMKLYIWDIQLLMNLKKLKKEVRIWMATITKWQNLKSWWQNLLIQAFKDSIYPHRFFMFQFFLISGSRTVWCILEVGRFSTWGSFVSHVSTTFPILRHGSVRDPLAQLSTCPSASNRAVFFHKQKTQYPQITMFWNKI